MLDQIAQLCMSHFLCRFDPKSRKKLTKDIVRKIAMEVYSPDKVNEFIDYALEKFQSALVEEFNQRLVDKRPLRFQIADDAGVGRIVAGYRQKKLAKEIRFQNSLHRMPPPEFEKLAAIALRILGCQDVFSTPTSHDQGVDAFGYQILVPPTPYGVTHHLTWIAQAKHYKATQVATGDIRELIGSTELLVAKVFSTVDERYKELRLLSYAPIAVALITTEEIPNTVRRLAEGAGVFVFASSDLYYLLAPSLKKKYTAGAVRAFVRKESKTIRTLA
jgi:hypothetical protein